MTPQAMRVFYKGLLLIAIPLVFQLVFVVVLSQKQEIAESTINAQIRHGEMRVLSYEIISRCHGCMLIITEEAISPRGGGGKALLEKNKAIVFELLEKLKAQARTDEEQHQVKSVERELRSYYQFLDSVLEISEASLHLTLEEESGLFTVVHWRMQKLHEAFNPLFRDGKPGHNAPQQEFLGDLKTWIFWGVLTSFAIAGGATFVFSTSFINRIMHLRENSLRLSRGAELLPSLKGSDEIAELDRVFHRVATIFSESFEREKAMFDSAADLICCLNGEGEIVRVNSTFQEALGYRAEETLNSKVSEYIAPVDRQKFLEFLDSLKNDKGKSRELEVQIVSRNGVIFDYSWSVRWESSRRSYYCVAHDTTQRKQLEQAKQDFVAMLSHDLRSPLTSLAMTIELVTVGALQKMPDKCVELFRLADKSVVRLVSLINELLDLEKLEAGEMDIALSVVPLERIVGTSMDSLRVTADAKGVSLVCQPSGDYVQADEQRVVRVMINLLANAIKYSNQGSKVEVSFEKAGGFVEVRVTDHGSGIPKEFLVQVFQRYKQVKDGKDIHKQGSGLGLSICKAIVEAHGGNIGVESTLGLGSTFWFTLKEAE